MYGIMGGVHRRGGRGRPCVGKRGWWGGGKSALRPYGRRGLGLLRIGTPGRRAAEVIPLRRGNLAQRSRRGRTPRCRTRREDITLGRLDLMVLPDS